MSDKTSATSTPAAWSWHIEECVRSRADRVEPSETAQSSGLTGRTSKIGAAAAVIAVIAVIATGPAQAQFRGVPMLPAPAFRPMLPPPLMRPMLPAPMPPVWRPPVRVPFVPTPQSIIGNAIIDRGGQRLGIVPTPSQAGPYGWMPWWARPWPAY